MNKVAGVVFAPQVSKIFIAQNYTEDKRKKIRKKQLRVFQGQYNDDKWQLIFQNSIEMNLIDLALTFNLRSSIIKDLENVKFSDLKKIWLCYNNIDNVQALSNVNMPNLEYINIDNNLICNYQSLRKCNWKNMGQFRICNNYCKQLNWICKIYCIASQSLYLDPNRNDHLKQQDISCLVKYQSEVFMLDLNNQNRIKQPKIQEILPKKAKTGYYMIHNFLKQ